jgi:hypothetical protein
MLLPYPIPRRAISAYLLDELQIPPVREGLAQKRYTRATDQRQPRALVQTIRRTRSSCYSALLVANRVQRPVGALARPDAKTIV